MKAWKPIAEHMAADEPYRVTVACYDMEDPIQTEVFVCRYSRGSYYPEADMATCEERGWRFYAWAEEPPAPSV